MNKCFAHSIFQSLCRTSMALLLTGALVPVAAAQEEPTDPATDTQVIEETLGKIRDVENLEKFIAENETLKGENNSLKEQVASLAEQVKKLTEELQAENERLRKQLLHLPEFTVKSRLVSASRATAVLQFGEKSIRIRRGVEMSVPVEGGVWTLMNVKNISNDFIELEFPELERTIVLYD